MFDLKFQQVQSDYFSGPGSFKFNFQEFNFSPRFHTYDNSRKSFERVLNSLKKTDILRTGAYKWIDNYYGPIVIEKIIIDDFKYLESADLYIEIEKLLLKSQKSFQKFDNQEDELNKVFDKIKRILAFIPYDITTFYIYNLEIKKVNTDIEKLIEHNLFDYFFSIIGYNEQRFYLITLFFE